MPDEAVIRIVLQDTTSGAQGGRATGGSQGNIVGDIASKFIDAIVTQGANRRANDTLIKAIQEQTAESKKTSEAISKSAEASRLGARELLQSFDLIRSGFVTGMNQFVVGGLLPGVKAGLKETDRSLKNIIDGMIAGLRDMDERDLLKKRPLNLADVKVPKKTSFDASGAELLKLEPEMTRGMFSQEMAHEFADMSKILSEQEDEDRREKMVMDAEGIRGTESSPGLVGAAIRAEHRRAGELPLAETSETFGIGLDLLKKARKPPSLMGMPAYHPVYQSTGRRTDLHPHGRLTDLGPPPPPEPPPAPPAPPAPARPTVTATGSVN